MLSFKSGSTSLLPGIMVKRRHFMALLAGAGAAASSWARPAWAQQRERTRRIGMLMGLAESDPEGQRLVKAHLDELQRLGWKSGVNLQIDLRWGNNDLARMQRLADELAGLQPDLIQVTTTPATAAVLRATRTIPVVFSVVGDPVGSGFVQSVPRPGTNATGFMVFESSLGGKWLELLKAITPRLARVAMMFNPATAPQTAYYRPPVEAAGPSFGVTVRPAPVSSAAEIETTIVALASDRGAGLIVLPDNFMFTYRDLIASLAARHNVPAVYPLRIFVRAGGLVAYGVDLPDLQRRAATYVDRILKGAKTTDLPVQLPTKFELAINLRAARALGASVPLSLLALADEVIE
jgi:putative ABC transport system substrate-binding protein